METNTDKNGFVIHKPFGNDLFGYWAEGFARFFGTPGFLIGQTIFVAIWIGINVVGITTFDLYPFILLNLAFSTQAAYAAPLILLAQTRQAERDKAWERTDAEHREELHKSVLQQQQHSLETAQQILELTQRLEKLTQELHDVLLKKD
jgi:uncharacterized membrane protein